MLSAIYPIYHHLSHFVSVVVKNQSCTFLNEVACRYVLLRIISEIIFPIKEKKILFLQFVVVALADREAAVLGFSCSEAKDHRFIFPFWESRINHDHNVESS